MFSQSRIRPAQLGPFSSFSPVVLGVVDKKRNIRDIRVIRVPQCCRQKRIFRVFRVFRCFHDQESAPRSWGVFRVFSPVVLGVVDKKRNIRDIRVIRVPQLL